MNAHGTASRAALIVGALTASLLAHAAAADDVMIVYGKRTEALEASGITQPEISEAGVLLAMRDDLRASIHGDIRASLRDDFSALRLEIARDSRTANDIKVASLAISAGV
jgi:hypothetical protein